jgi:ATP-binding cassette, subfamily F, member 3
MILLDVQDVRRHFGPEPVLDGVTFEVRPGERIGLVGPNGSGKTTLLRILAGRDDADAGSFQRHAAVHLGYLEQQPRFEPGRTLHDEARDALAALISLEEEAQSVAAAIGETTDEAEHHRLAARFDHLQHELQRRDAYNLDYKIERVLDGLRFTRAARNQPVDSLSGGEQNRLMLAKLLLAEPNLMLLDEPSNHLDIEATEWLEEFLVESSAAMIVVSHDRYFLDKVTNRTLELFRGTVDSYAGNFSAYWQQKGERLLVQRRTYEKQQIEIEKTKDFIRRNAYGQKHSQAEDRRKKLDRIEPVPPPREIAAPPMGFPAAARSGDIALRADGLAKSYDRPLFADVSMQVIRGERWAVLGPNGCGKTTLLRCLLGLAPPDRGTAVLGTGVVVGYFDQQLAGLDEDAPAYDSIRPPHKQFNDQQRRDLLARFGVTGDTALQKVGSLSGGERCRVALARLAAADANFLVLDEPTNHLDLWARDALENALRNFDGTAVFVSHDRYFVNRVADHLLVVEGDGVRPIEGNYETYQQFLKRRADEEAEETSAANPKPAKGGKSPAKPAKAKDKDKDSKQSKRRFPFRKVADIEDEIFAQETCVQELQRQLGQEETCRNGNLVRQMTADLAEHQEALKTLYAHWEEANELNW